MISQVKRTWLALLACGAAVAATATCGDNDDKPPPFPGVSSGMNSSGVASSGTGGSGGQSGSGGSGGATTTLASFCDSVVDPFCEALFACCTDPTELDHFGGTAGQCKAQFYDSCLTTGQSAGVNALLATGDTVLNTPELADCVNDLEALSQSCAQPPRFALYRCWGAFEGQTPAGGDCGAGDAEMSWVECQDGTCHLGTCIPFLETGVGCITGANPPATCNVGDSEQCVTDGITLPTCGEPLEDGSTCVVNSSLYQYQCASLHCSYGQCQTPTAELLCVAGH